VLEATARGTAGAAKALRRRFDRRPFYPTRDVGRRLRIAKAIAPTIASDPGSGETADMLYV
jgi:hypothetical protein